MRVVLDTNILVRANAKTSGPARRLLLSVAAPPHTLLLSSFLLDETERVLAYPRLRSRWRLSQRDVEEHIEFLYRVSELVHAGPIRSVVSEDPYDDAVVQTAVDGRADKLCTLDNHFMSRR